MKLIPLTQGQFAKVDDGDFDKYGIDRWSARWSRLTNSFYAVRNSKTDIYKKRKTLLLHREIMGITETKIHVDHKNHDTLDCQRQNLRPCTHSQNMMNKSKAYKNSNSGIRGVRLDIRSGRWQARIRINGKGVHLGMFSNMEDAKSAYASANQKYFGEFGGVK